MGTRGAYELEEMAGGWAAEKSLFRPGIFPAVSSSGQWSDVAHYTQMIWKGTTPGRLRGPQGPRMGFPRSAATPRPAMWWGSGCPESPPHAQHGEGTRLGLVEG